MILCNYALKCLSNLAQIVYNQRQSSDYDWTGISIAKLRGHKVGCHMTASLSDSNPGSPIYCCNPWNCVGSLGGKRQKSQAGALMRVQVLKGSGVDAMVRHYGAWVG